MTPNQLQDNAAALLDLYARAEEEMLRKVARRLARGIDENGWAERKYGEIRQLQVEIRRSLEHLARQSSELRNALVENAFETGEAAFQDEYRALGGFLRAVPESRFNAVATLTNELSERFEAAHSAILRDVDDNYRRIIGAAVSMQATGTITTRDAVKSALNSFAEKGIIGFVDKAGRHWNMDSYAEMAVRTGLMRAMREGYRQDALAHGEELVIISEHEDTCPLCVDWERAVLALTDAGAQHPEAEGTLAEAEAAGLFHPNCGHSMTVYVPGLTDKTSRKRETQGYTREQDLEGYANRQQQRYMERQVRAWKRRQAVATTPEDERYAKAYVDKWQRALRAYTGETKLPRLNYREGGRVLLSEKARKLKPLKFDENGRIIQPENKNVIYVAGRAMSGYFRADKQQEHIWATEQFAKRFENALRGREMVPSSFYEGTDVEALVRPHIGQGIVRIRGTTISEYIDAGKNIGSVWVDEEMIYRGTQYYCIRYSRKNGWHAFPVKEIPERKK